MIFVGLTITLFIFVLILGGVQNTDGPPLPRGDSLDLLQPGEKEEFIHEGGEAAGLQQRKHKQCYLVDKIVEIAEYSIGRNDRFKGFSLVTGNLAKINGKLLSKREARPLFELSEKQIAGLFPYIKLYTKRKVGTPAKLTWVEIPFGQFLKSDRRTPWEVEEDGSSLIFSGFLGSGSGIKSFSYTLAGTNPEEAQKVIGAKLKLWFQSLSDLFFENGQGVSPF